MNTYLIQLGKQAKQASRILTACTTEQKNKAIMQVAADLEERQTEILAANQKDLDVMIASGKNLHMKDRLLLTAQRIGDMAEGARQVAVLTDPIGEVVESFTRPNGLAISKVRAPMGVIGIIYESRPNVTIDAAVLCLKVGSAVILRGGSEAIHSNSILVKIISDALVKAGLPADSVQLVTQTDRQVATEFMRLNQYVDVLIPRGGAGLIRAVLENATIPVIETGTGNCHVYVDSQADQKMADEIVMNAKTQRPSVCNAIESLLIEQSIAAAYLPGITRQLTERGVEIRGCEQTLQILKAAELPDLAVPAEVSDWETEYNDLILAVKVVKDVQEAVEHINQYGTRHSECIVSANQQAIDYFQKNVDAACVYANASTRFTDGFEFGFGAEIGISNQKLHARGPMGLKELTTIKYIICGTGQVRG